MRLGSSAQQAQSSVQRAKEYLEAWHYMGHAMHVVTMRMCVSAQGYRTVLPQREIGPNLFNFPSRGIEHISPDKQIC